MKILYLILALLMAGCFGSYTFTPVSSMSVYQMQHEYLEVEEELRQKQKSYSRLSNMTFSPTSTPEYYYSPAFTGSGMGRLKKSGLKRNIERLQSRLDELDEAIKPSENH